MVGCVVGTYLHKIFSSSKEFINIQMKIKINNSEEHGIYV